jgi:mycothiol synthase
LRFRRFRDNSDFDQMARVIEACKKTDGIERTTTGESLARFYHHQTNWKATSDIVYAESDGLVVGYGAVFWYYEADGTFIGWHLGFVLPAWRERGLGRALLQRNEQRLWEIKTSQPPAPCFLQVEATDTEQARIKLLEHAGYVPVRYTNRMLRMLDEPIPNIPLPQNITLRPVQPQHYEAIRLASNEAFRDHWASADMDEAEFAMLLDSPDFDQTLWQVAWQGDEIVGMVLNMINRAENLEYHRMRGWMYNVAVRRPWRGQGVAKALLAQSLHIFKARAMTEVVLHVDTENLSGALRLYESLGFRPIKRVITYRKQLA